MCELIVDIWLLRAAKDLHHTGTTLRHLYFSWKAKSTGVSMNQGYICHLFYSLILYSHKLILLVI